MRLQSIEVKNFRNILDSGEVLIQPDVTCLVGKNESGKTAVLQALYRQNPAYPEDKFDLSRDYPRWRLVKDRKSGNLNEVTPVGCTFELDEADVQAVERALGVGALLDRKYIRHKTYENSGLSSTSVDLAVVVNHVLDLAESPPALRAALSSVREPKDFPAAASAGTIEGVAAADIERLTKAVAECVGDQSASTAARDVLRSRVPKFFYFGDYQTLPGRIDIRELGAGHEEPGASDIQTARALLAMAGTTAEALTDEEFEERKAELEAVSNELSQEVFEFWTQNTELSVEIDLDKITETTQNNYGQQQTAVARYLEVRVKDRRHGFTNNFDQRSSGFQWFFSFLAAFSQFEDLDNGVIVLLDEPALTLHGKAQADFLRFIDERLAPVAQVIYTTHSPFMVDPRHLERVRIVEDRGPAEGVQVTNEVLSVSDDSLFPLQAALGYDIAQSLFVGPDNLLVEGTSDFTYLTLLSDHLRSLGREGLSERWRILPTGGATNIPAFVALMGRNLDVSVLVDGAGQGLQRIHNLADRGLLSRQRIFLTDLFTGGVAPSDIEDLFDPDDYLVLYNKAFNKRLKTSSLDGTDRMISRIGRKQGEAFTDHGRPADVLLRGRDTLLPGLAEATLQRFEELFSAVNQSLA